MNPFFIVNKTSDIPEILVYGYIGDEDVNSGEFVKELRALEKVSDKINVRINSGGGSVFEGIAIYNAMKNSKAEINTYVDGLAASMGSVIALGGKKCFMSKMARMMTHRASGLSAGGSDSMRQTADLLDSLGETVATIYASKTGLTSADAKKKFLGLDDKWMTAEEALAEKLVDGIFDAEAIDIPASAKSDKEVWQLYNQTFTNKININNMKTITLTADQLGKLNLKAESQPADINTAIDSLIAKAARVDELTGKLNIAETAKNTAETALSTLKKESCEKEVTAILAGAVKEMKMTKALSEKLKIDYAENPTGLKALVDSMPVYSSITEKIDEENDASELKALTDKTYTDLDKSGQLARLKELSLDAFKAKFKKQFGKEYTGK